MKFIYNGEILNSQKVINYNKNLKNLLGNYKEKVVYPFFNPDDILTIYNKDKENIKKIESMLNKGYVINVQLFIDENNVVSLISDGFINSDGEFYKFPFPIAYSLEQLDSGYSDMKILFNAKMCTDGYNGLLEYPPAQSTKKDLMPKIIGEPNNNEKFRLNFNTIYEQEARDKSIPFKKIYESFITYIKDTYSIKDIPPFAISFDKNVANGIYDNTGKYYSLYNDKSKTTNEIPFINFLQTKKVSEASSLWYFDINGFVKQDPNIYSIFYNLSDVPSAFFDLACKINKENIVFYEDHFVLSNGDRTTQIPYPKNPKNPKNYSITERVKEKYADLLRSLSFLDWRSFFSNKMSTEIADALLLKSKDFLEVFIPTINFNYNDSCQELEGNDIEKIVNNFFNQMIFPIVSIFENSDQYIVFVQMIGNLIELLKQLGYADVQITIDSNNIYCISKSLNLKATIPDKDLTVLSNVIKGKDYKENYLLSLFNPSERKQLGENALSVKIDETTKLLSIQQINAVDIPINTITIYKQANGMFFITGYDSKHNAVVYLHDFSRFPTKLKDFFNTITSTMPEGTDVSYEVNDKGDAQQVQSFEEYLKSCREKKINYIGFLCKIIPFFKKDISDLRVENDSIIVFIQNVSEPIKISLTDFNKSLATAIKEKYTVIESPSAFILKHPSLLQILDRKNMLELFKPDELSDFYDLWFNVDQHIQRYVVAINGKILMTTEFVDECIDDKFKLKNFDVSKQNIYNKTVVYPAIISLLLNNEMTFRDVVSKVSLVKASGNKITTLSIIVRAMIFDICSKFDPKYDDDEFLTGIYNAIPLISLKDITSVAGLKDFIYPTITIHYFSELQKKDNSTIEAQIKIITKFDGDFSLLSTKENFTKAFVERAVNEFVTVTKVLQAFNEPEISIIKSKLESLLNKFILNYEEGKYSKGYHWYHLLLTSEKYKDIAHKYILDNLLQDKDFIEIWLQSIDYTSKPIDLVIKLFNETFGIQKNNILLINMLEDNAFKAIQKQPKEYTQNISKTTDTFIALFRDKSLSIQDFCGIKVLSQLSLISFKKDLDQLRFLGTETTGNTQSLDSGLPTDLFMLNERRFSSNTLKIIYVLAEKIASEATKQEDLDPLLFIPVFKYNSSSISLFGKLNAFFNGINSYIDDLNGLEISREVCLSLYLPLFYEACNLGFKSGSEILFDWSKSSAKSLWESPLLSVKNIEISSADDCAHALNIVSIIFKLFNFNDKDTMLDSEIVKMIAFAERFQEEMLNEKGELYKFIQTPPITIKTYTLMHDFLELKLEQLKQTSTDSFATILQTLCQQIMENNSFSPYQQIIIFSLHLTYPEYVSKSLDFQTESISEFIDKITTVDELIKLIEFSMNLMKLEDEKLLVLNNFIFKEVFNKISSLHGEDKRKFYTTCFIDYILISDPSLKERFLDAQQQYAIHGLDNLTEINKTITSRFNGQSDRDIKFTNIISIFQTLIAELKNCNDDSFIGDDDFEKSFANLYQCAKLLTGDDATQQAKEKKHSNEILLENLREQLAKAYFDYRVRGICLSKKNSWHDVSKKLASSLANGDELPQFMRDQQEEIDALKQVLQGKGIFANAKINDSDSFGEVFRLFIEYIKYIDTVEENNVNGYDKDNVRRIMLSILSNALTSNENKNNSLRSIAIAEKGSKRDEFKTIDDFSLVKNKNTRAKQVCSESTDDSRVIDDYFNLEFQVITLIKQTQLAIDQLKPNTLDEEEHGKERDIERDNALHILHDTQAFLLDFRKNMFFEYSRLSFLHDNAKTAMTELHKGLQNRCTFIAKKIDETYKPLSWLSEIFRAIVGLFSTTTAKQNYDREIVSDIKSKLVLNKTFFNGENNESERQLSKLTA